MTYEQPEMEVIEIQGCVITDSGDNGTGGGGMPVDEQLLGL